MSDVTMAEHPLSDAILDALERYFRDRPEVSLAFLFGSTARGQARAGSDLDFAILIERDAVDGFDRSQMVWDLMHLCKREDVDLVLLNRASPLMTHRVVRDGYVLFARNTRVLAEFTIRAVQSYVDTRPLRELKHRRLHQRLAAGLRAGRGHPSPTPRTTTASFGNT
ncbi:DNA polymerase subunit beta [Limnochorda pilosa]|uniref:DNA polymerase subunit beta n=1 Tax=Limnochorda pilosa TaxID=1555112 RepID=A0A0K2SNS3_LIMPI|nr:DNA polymerase subunit beta [Limnochorda pilosa]